MNIAVSITALFSGSSSSSFGGLADRVGRVKIVQIGFIFGIVGSLLVGLAPTGAVAAAVLMLGRICQGCRPRASCRPAWRCESILGRRQTPARHQPLVDGLLGRLGLRRAVRGPDGGERRLALDLHRCAAVSVIGMLMVRGTPESKVEATANTSSTQGHRHVHGRHGRAAGVRDARWSPGLDEPRIASAVVTALVVGVLFVGAESGNPNAFVDFRLFEI